MTTISLVPSSTSLEREMTAFFPPIQTARRAKTDRIARGLPRIPEASHIETLGFAILVVATAATLFFSVVALLEFAAR